MRLTTFILLLLTLTTAHAELSIESISPDGRNITVATTGSWTQTIAPSCNPDFTVTTQSLCNSTHLSQGSIVTRATVTLDNGAGTIYPPAGCFGAGGQPTCVDNLNVTTQLPVQSGGGNQTFQLNTSFGPLAFYGAGPDGEYVGKLTVSVGNAIATTHRHQQSTSLPIWVKNGTVYLTQPVTVCTYPTTHEVDLGAVTPPNTESRIVELSGTCDWPVSGTATLSGGVIENGELVIADSNATTRAYFGDTGRSTSTPISGTTPTAAVHIDVTANTGTPGGGFRHAVLVTWSFD